MADMSYYILFRNHTEGMELYHYLRKQNLAVRISPAPRTITTCCGMSILVNPEDIMAVRKAVANSDVRIDRIVEIENQINPKRDKYC